MELAANIFSMIALLASAATVSVVVWRYAHHSDEHSASENVS
jgi:hypothetical protein